MRQTKRINDVKNDVVLEPAQTKEVAKTIRKNGGNTNEIGVYVKAIPSTTTGKYVKKRD